MRFTYKLADYADVINGGAWAEDEYTSSGIRVVKVTNMVNGTICDETLSYLPISAYDKYKAHKLFKGDLVLATVGSHPDQPNSVVGKTAIIPERFDGAFLNQNAACIRVKDKTKVDLSFLTILSRTIHFKHHVVSRARGSANQVRLAIGELKKFSYAFPSILIQRKIAAMLSAYDDLIENNNRRIAILEKMAEELYREWFVRLRFPRHEKVKIIKGVPENWHIEKITDYIVLERGFEPGSKEYLAYEDSNSIPFIRVGDLTAKRPSAYLKKEKFNQSQVMSDDIIISFDGTIGIVRMGVYGYYSSGIRKVVRKQALPISYLYFLLKSTTIQSVIHQHATGSTILHASSSINYLKFIKPDNDLLYAFGTVCDPLIKAILKKEDIRRTLELSRDRLLSRLMSGKIDVEHLDIAFPKSMINEADAEQATELRRGVVEAPASMKGEVNVNA